MQSSTYRGYEIRTFMHASGVGWTRVVSPFNSHLSIWRLMYIDITAAKEFIDGLIEEQERKFAYRRSENASKKQPQQVTDALKYLQLKKCPSNKEEVQAAYKPLAIKYHPDRKGGSEEAMKMLNNARDVVITYLS